LTSTPPQSPIHPTKVFLSKHQRIQVISAKESGVIFLKKEVERNPLSIPKRVAKYGVQIRPNSIRVGSHLFHSLQIFHPP
jgi:hypothetical protein